MSGRNALGIAESLAAESLSNVSSHAIVYSWQAAPASLASALKRADSFRYAFIKRAFDMILSALLLVLFLPLGLVIGLLIKLSSSGPIFYCEERMGRFCAPFRIVKFRSMYISPADVKVLDISRAQRNHRCPDRMSKRSADPRITPLGRWLRRMSLDELPQLWNVLLGDMSLVGPRPIVAAERRLYGRYLPFYDLFCPGITGLWQVSGRSDIDYDRRVLLDCEYASRWSCLLDLTILGRTIPAVITMRGAY